MGFYPIVRNEHPVVWRNRALQAQRALREERSVSYSVEDPRLAAIFSGGTSSAGSPVNSNTALGVAAVAACVGLLADMIALLPLRLYRRTERGDIEVPDHPSAAVINRPGDLHTSFEMRQLAMTGVGLGGNGYIRVYRDGRGDAQELEWLSPADVAPQRPTGQRFITYRVNGVRELLTRYDLIHVRGLSRDGIMGVAPITQMRESIGTSIAQREAAGTMMKNGVRPAGVVQMPLSATEPQVKKMRADFTSNYEGAPNAGKAMILWGAEFKPVSGMSAADAQFIESRVFELREIARWYRIPPVLIGDTQASTSFGAGIEQQNLGFLAYSLRPWFENWQQAIDYTLLTPDELRAGLHFEFDLEELGAVTLQAKAAFITAMRNAGVFSPNESRRWLGYVASDAAGMDDYRAPLNSSSSGSAPANTEEPAEPQPADAA